MDYQTIESEFHDKEFAVTKFIPLVLESENVRDNLISNLIDGHNHINVYYRSFYLVDEASKLKPELFYQYWDKLTKLLTYQSTYHRLIGQTVLTNLIVVDELHKFDTIKKTFFTLLSDEKVLNGIEAVKHLIIINKYRPDLTSEIVEFFLDESLLKNYSQRQTERFYALYLEYFDTVLERKDDPRLKVFIEKCLSVKNTNTLKIAKKLFKKYCQ